MAISLDEKSPATWWFMLLLSTLMLVVFLYNIPRAIHIYQVSKSGELASVEITQIKEVTVGSRHTYYLHFKYLGEQQSSITIGKSLSDSIVHDKEIKLRHLSNYPDLFLAPDYDTEGQSISHIILVCFFAFMVPFSIYKIRTLRY
jgi:hypothetical protein